MKLEKPLVTDRYFLNLFGLKDFENLKEILRNTKESYNSVGRSYFINALIKLKPDWEIEFLKYDEALKNYVEKLKKKKKTSKN